VDFYSDSCVACKRLSPVLAEAEENYSGKVKVYKVNTNFDAKLAEEYDVTANPTLLFVANGEVKDKKQGAMRPAELSAWIDGLL
jgi:thioredoxin 1